jgi:RecB family exonuclease
LRDFTLRPVRQKVGLVWDGRLNKGEINDRSEFVIGYSIAPAPPKGEKPKVAGRYVLSASQISTFVLCRRKWAWRYIARIPDGPNAAAELGGRVHTVLERWLALGIAPDPATREGRIALAGLKHLPPPGSGTVEHGFLLHTPRNTYLGFIDWLGLIAGAPTILDHKTTSNLQYAKTEEDLQSDIQALIYALFAALAWSTDEIGLMWVYYTTGNTPRSPKPTIAKLRLPMVLELFETIEAFGEEISYHAKNQTHPLALKPDARACGAYGGCPHRERCNLSPEEEMESLMTTMEEKLGMVPVFVQGGVPQQNFPVWNGQTAGSPQPVMPHPLVVPSGQFINGPQRAQDGLLYAQTADGVWHVVPEAPPAHAPQPTAISAQKIIDNLTTTPPAAINAPEGPAPSESKKGRGRPAGSGAKKLEKMTADRLAFLAGVHGAIMRGISDPVVLQSSGELALVAYKSKFGE